MTITEYILGLLSVCSLLMLWFVSPLKSTLGQIIFKKNLTPDQFDDWLYIKHPFIGKLLSCWICCSFWLSLFVGVIIWGVFNSSILTPLLTFLTYPALAYLYKVLIKH